MRKTKITKSCFGCGVEFLTYPDGSKSRTNKFCGRNCWQKNRPNIDFTPEVRLKISLSRRGEKNPSWKGGRTKFKLILRGGYKYRQWRSDVFTRDDFTCQFCGERGGILNADHIKQLSLILDENNIKTLEDAENCEELWNINNGRTLCVPCHKRTDTYAKNTRYKLVK